MIMWNRTFKFNDSIKKREKRAQCRFESVAFSYFPVRAQPFLIGTFTIRSGLSLSRFFSSLYIDHCQISTFSSCYRCVTIAVCHFYGLYTHLFSDGGWTFLIQTRYIKITVYNGNIAYVISNVLEYQLDEEERQKQQQISNSW